MSGDFESKKLDQFRTRPAQTALDRADLDIADLGRFFVGEAARADQSQHLALFGRELGQRLAEILEVEVAFLIAGDDEAARIGAVAVLDLAPALAIVGIVRCCAGW